jgi:hypothetical protein
MKKRKIITAPDAKEMVRQLKKALEELDCGTIQNAENRVREVLFLLTGKYA